MGMKHVTAHSDGACRGNPGPGAWAAVLECEGRRKELSGGCLATTNNRMELEGAIEALRALKTPCEVDFHTDSKYLQNGVSAWMFGWKRNGWLTKAKQPVKNADLWRALDEQVRRHRVRWHWVKGHAGHAQNERCDALANAVIDRLQAGHSRAQMKAALEAFRSEAAPPLLLG